MSQEHKNKDIDSMTKEELLVYIEKEYNMLMLRKEVADTNSIDHECYDYLQGYIAKVKTYDTKMLRRIAEAIKRNNETVHDQIREHVLTVEMA